MSGEESGQGSEEAREGGGEGEEEGGEESEGGGEAGEIGGVEREGCECEDECASARTDENTQEGIPTPVPPSLVENTR